MTQTAPLVTAHPEHHTTLVDCQCGDFKHRATPRYSTRDKRRCKHIFRLEQELAHFETSLTDRFGRPYCGCSDFIKHEADSCFHIDMLRQHAPAAKPAAFGSRDEDWACFQLV